MSEPDPDDDNAMLHPGGCPCPRCAFEPDSAPALLAECRRQRAEIERLRAALTLSLRELDRHADAPAEDQCQQHWDSHSEEARNVARAALIAAAPALLSECQHQRHLLDAFAASVQDMLDAWDHPTSASVSMRCSAIAGLRGIMEHWPAGATDPEVTRLNAELTRLRAERTAQGFRTVEEI